MRSLDVQLPDSPSELPVEALRILVVDDDASATKLLKAALERAGYGVLLASTPDEAWALMDESPDIHAAVIDAELPEERARGLVQSLMSRKLLCRSILVTSSAQMSASELAGSAAHIYLRRPKTIPELLDAVSRTVRSTIDWRNALNPTPASMRARGRAAGDAPPPVHFELQRAVSRLRYIANLSPAETMAAWRLLWGDSNKRIAELLGCTERTVKFHVAEVLARTGARSRAGLLRVLLEDSGIRDPWDQRGNNLDARAHEHDAEHEFES